MTHPVAPFHAALVFVDHAGARIYRLDANHKETMKLAPHGHHSAEGRHKTDGKAEHDAKFLHTVVEGLKGMTQILIVGPGLAKTELAHHMENHDKQLFKNVIGVEAVDHPTEPQLLALAKERFRLFEKRA